MPSQGARIPRKAYELPLLKSLVELGGSIKLGKQLYDIVAEKMGFAGKEIDYDPVRARQTWIYDLQWVATKLRERGQMDGSQRGIWKITEKGRERVRLEWDSFKNSFNLNDYISEDN
jgi:restriction system protein